MEREQHWLSLEDLRGDPALRRLREREFAEPLPVVPPAGEAGTDGGRRSFLKLMGFGVSLVGLGACARAPVHEAVPFVHKPPELTPGEPLWYATTCSGCSAGCGLLVKTRDGRPIKIEGNDRSPLNAGGTCAVGQATVLSLYDSTRLRGPLWQGRPVAWDELDRRVRRRLDAVARAGHKMAILTGTVNGPASRALLDEWRSRYPRTRVVSYDPVSAAALRRANAESFGRPVVPRYRFDRARAVVGLEADFLGTWISPVEHTRGYVARRRLDGDADVAWHGQFESGLSVTGANADRRVPVEASEVGLVALALFDRLRRRAGLQVAGPLPAVTADATLLDEAADRLWQHRGESLLVCGLNDPSVQVVVNAANDLLGNIGTTVDLGRPSLQKLGDEAELARLVEEIERGEIQALILWGVNPGYAHPAAREILAALDRVALTVSFGDRLDETAAAVDAVCPDHHPLAAWGDAEPVAGTLSLSQPTLAPLFDTRAAAESLLRWMGRPETHYDYLRRHWRREIFPRQSRWSDFDSFWDHTLQDGALTLEVEDTAPGPFAGDLEAASRAVLATAAAGRLARERGAFDLVLYQKVGLRDGRWANNPWLQELPDPVTRVTWGNYVAVSPRLAERLGLSQEDVVRLEGDGGTAIELPVLVQPGQAPGTLGVALGYGRRRAGKVADGVGADAYPLVRSVEDLFRYTATGVTLERTGRSALLASTQYHHAMEGRPLVKETTLAAYRENRAAGNGEREALPDLWPERHEPNHAWGMVVDLNACTGCAACVVACQAENNVPVVGPEEVARSREMHWIRVDRYYRGSEESPDTVFQPMMCQQCDHAPCETVCPVLATVHSSDGLNQQIYNRCVGTRYCANNCPYKVRRFNWFNYAHNDRFDYEMNDELGTMVLNPDVVVRSRGVMEKCSMCIQRIQAGRLRAERQGRAVADGDIETACQSACPADAIVFGDLNDRDSRVARRNEDGRFYHVLEELGVRPSVGYLSRVRNRKET